MSRSFLEITNEFPGYDDLAEPQKHVPLSLRDKLSIFRIIGICCSIIAFQIANCMKYTLQVPIMRRLNIRESFMALITITDPLSHLIVQPFVESISDNCQLKFGRRRPFIIAGGAGIVLSFLCFFLMNLNGAHNALIGFLFSISLLILNISLHLLQYPSQLIVNDLIPQKQQAIASLISKLSLHITAFLINLINGFLYKFFDQLVFLFAACVIFILITITALAGKEEPLLIAKENQNTNPIVSIFSTMKSMPTPILRIAIVYSLCWFSYYPFLLECTDFFGTTIFLNYQRPYNSGVSFGIFAFSLINLLVLIYFPFHDKIVQKFGLRNVLAVSLVVASICLILVWIPIPMFARFAILSPMGICEMIFNSVPFFIISLSVPADHVSNYNGLLNSFASFSKIVSSFLIFAFFGEICSHKVVILGMGFLFSAVAAFACKYIVLPQSDTTVMEPLAPSSDYYNFD